MQPEAVKGHLLSEALGAEFKWSRPEARILAARTSAADFFAYFFHPRKKVGPTGEVTPLSATRSGTPKKSPLRERSYLGLR